MRHARDAGGKVARLMEGGHRHKKVSGCCGWGGGGVVQLYCNSGCGGGGGGIEDELFQSS
jgi:hypothetical protein